MNQEYEYIYNRPEANMKVDASWERYMSPNGVDKTRERYEYSIDHLVGSVLDVGAGDGFGAYLMRRNVLITNITCLEVQDEAIKRMRENLVGLASIRIVKDTIEHFSPGYTFDCVHCGHTLEHVLDEQKALKNIERLTRMRAIISVPLNGGINKMHLREYKTVEQVTDLISKFFSVEKTKIYPKGGNVYSLVVIANKKKKE